ncbi:MAG: hypothetical protein HY775_03705 [Acidobacteria bacterium]|nr:hypothetical protein [Acidobacteriota bacterium]
MRLRPGILLASFILLALFGAACGGGRGRAGDGSPGIGTQPAGVAAIDERRPGEKLPKGFRPDIPLPPDYRVLSSASRTNNTLGTYFSAETSPAELRRLFLAELPKKGWWVTVCQVSRTSSEPVTTLMASKDRTLLTVVIGGRAPGQELKDGQVSFFIQTFEAPEPIPKRSPFLAGCR